MATQASPEFGAVIACVASLYEAALDPGRRQDALARLRDLVGADAAERLLRAASDSDPVATATTERVAEGDGTLYSLLAEHAARAARFGRIAERRAQVGVARRLAIDQLEVGVVLLDARGHVLSANTAAKDVLTGGDGLETRGDRVSARRATERDLVNGAVTDCARHGRRATLVVPRPSGLRPYVLVATSLPRDDTSFVDGRPAVTLFIRDPERRGTVPRDLLKTLFGLTDREAALACGLSRGLSLTDTCEAMRVTRETGRGYLRTVFRKTGTARQPELVRLLLSVSPELRHG